MGLCLAPAVGAGKTVHLVQQSGAHAGIDFDPWQRGGVQLRLVFVAANFG